MFLLGCGASEAKVAAQRSALSSGLSDEFNDAATLSSWTVANLDLASTLDIDTATPGQLTIVPKAVNRNAWYSDYQAPYLWKSVTGDFVAEIFVRVASTASSDPNVAPRGPYNSAGFVLRDPASAGRADSTPLSSPIGRESWIMYNLGFQMTNVSREAKTTVMSSAGSASLSTLYLNATPNGINNGRLRVCRLGSTIHMYHMHANESAFAEEPLLSTTQRMGNGAGRPTPGVGMGVVSFYRPDLPATIEVGLVGNAWGPPFQTLATFDYVRFGAVGGPADCTAPITPL